MEQTTNSPLRDISVQICEILRYLENGKGYAKSDKTFGVIERGVELHVINSRPTRTFTKITIFILSSIFITEPNLYYSPISQWSERKNFGHWLSLGELSTNFNEVLFQVLVSTMTSNAVRARLVSFRLDVSRLGKSRVENSRLG